MPPIPVVNIASSEFKANPFAFYARLRSEAPVYRTVLPDKQSAWLITRYEDVLAVLKDERFGKDRLRAKSSEQIKKQPWMPGMFRPLTRNMLDLDAPGPYTSSWTGAEGFPQSVLKYLKSRERHAKSWVEIVGSTESSGAAIYQDSEATRAFELDVQYRALLPQEQRDDGPPTFLRSLMCQELFLMEALLSPNRHPASDIENSCA